MKIKIHNLERHYEVSQDRLTNTWFASDPHFDHTNIIEYCQRPFKSADEMNYTMKGNWNSRVKPDDLVIFLGDMTFGRGNRPARWWATQLNGRKIYIKGSHDEGVRPTSQINSVLFVADALVLDLAGTPVYAVHARYNAPWDWRGWVIHGHLHNIGSVIKIAPKKSYINVSMDMTGFSPVRADEILEITNHDWRETILNKTPYNYKFGEAAYSVFPPKEEVL